MGWQLDNEFNCETDEFYSDADHTAFREYAKQKYGTIDALNEAWGTVFWSETYTDWRQIHCPRPVLNGGHNPHLLLDYTRFISESCLSFAKMQADILRAYIKPGDFITTNGLFGNLDNHRLLNEVLDVYTYDSYPDFAFGLDRDPRTSNDLNDRKWSRHLIETRSICPHFGIMEQQAGGGGWINRMEMPAPRPGQLALWAMQSVAQGADYLSFFRWRTCAFGTEMYWHGILDYDNRDNRKLAEVKEFGKLLRTLDPVCLHLSILDGWTVEGTWNGINGYTVEYPGLDDDIPWEERHWKDHKRIMEILEEEIIPTYYDNKLEWARLMRQALRTSEAYFNSDRMVVEYYNRLYKPIAHAGREAGMDDDDEDTKMVENPNLDAWTFSNIK